MICIRKQRSIKRAQSEKEGGREMSRVLSTLLSIRENGLIFNLLGSDCSASACAVVQLYLANTACKGKKSEWQIHSCGVVCLVQDKKLHSTFIRLFCVKKAKLLWEQELYTPFTYSTPRPFFHTFPSDECWAGLNFSDEDEASRFHTAVQNCISGTKARPMFVRTHSLDSASGWLLRNKLNSCLSLSRSASPKAPPSAESEVTNTLSLAQRKGPLPPIPSNRDAATSIPPHHDNLKQRHSIPLPPSYPAPKLNINPTTVKKSASFSPGGNYSFTVEKQQRRSHFTDDI
ncbi:actin nucleation-promoting factor WAS isoform X1 [Pangasianodon hypophthalmus]|uniref:actin nucleation-promoting factor WAS isoform X1 n=2 Tax=Pangasianodon hypophthalmus TaxID=310915 RepID=UPI0023070D51|nr:actin nucleation-promoting factor WAS isoform X1 [Pangasianodon hypophthalmus]